MVEVDDSSSDADPQPPSSKRPAGKPKYRISRKKTYPSPGMAGPSQPPLAEEEDDDSN
jgi:hypothetical protein